VLDVGVVGKSSQFSLCEKKAAWMKIAMLVPAVIAKVTLRI
jgi:hypothetical protein